MTTHTEGVITMDCRFFSWRERIKIILTILVSGTITFYQIDSSNIKSIIK